MQKIIILLLGLLTFTAQASPQEYLDSIGHDKKALYNFFIKMPKGGELHYHFTGSSYFKDLVDAAKNKGYFLNNDDYQISKTARSRDFVAFNKFLNNKNNRMSLIRAWSMQDLTGSYKRRFDHFFAVFAKVDPIYSDNYKKLLSGQILRAARQNEMYLEIMLLPFTNSKKYRYLIKDVKSYSDMRRNLLSNKQFILDVKQLIQKNSAYLKDVYNYLGCNKHSGSKVCQIKIRSQLYVLRNTPIADIFIQAQALFEAAAQSNDIVAVNLVQAESGYYAMRDFDKQMQIFKFMHAQYPKVNIALHAGELDYKTSELDDLCCHINKSIYIGQAQRIGHGTDIFYEKNNQQLLNYMAKNNIAVEINLISNKLILSIQGKEQPLLYYLQHNVPVVLSTDDEGILQTNLTKQYVEAVYAYKLDYQTLKKINRNTLTYSFLPGKSIWQDANKQILVTECQNLDDNKCKQFIKNNEKASMQWLLEKRLAKFEQQFR